MRQIEKQFIGILIIGFVSSIIISIIIYEEKEMTLEDYSVCMHYHPELTTLKELNEKC